MFIPDIIKNAITTSPLDNALFFQAEDMWNRLSEVRYNRISYINEDMALLTKTCERFYKGFIIANNLKDKAPVDLMEDSHSLLRLTDFIEANICELQSNLTREDKKVRANFLHDFSKKYITCSYFYDQPSKEEFDTCFDWVSKQRELIINYFKPKEIPMDIIEREDLT